MMDEAPAGMNRRTPQTDEVQRRIGRNVVLFQEIEYLLKYLNMHAALEGPGSKLAELFEKRAELVHRKTMGDLAGRLVDTVLTPPVGDEDVPEEIDESWLVFRTFIETDAESVQRHDAEMRTLVEARNDLIHHFLPRWDLAANGDAGDALAYLDAQRDEAIKMKERLRQWALSVETGRKCLADYIASPAGAREFELLFVRQTPLVVMLGEIAMNASRADGWTLLSTAGHVIKRDAPEELKDLRTRFGHPKLKGVLLAAELFDVGEEPMSGGGTRTIYRINSKWALRVQLD